MARIATLEAVITANDQFTKKLAPMQKGLAAFGNSAKSLSTSLATLAVPLGLLQRNAINTARDFDAVAVSVEATAKAGGAAEEQYTQLRDIALDFGKKGLFSAQEVSEAMLDMVRDGLTPATISGGQLQAVFDLAGASGESLADTQVALSDTMQAFKLGVDDASSTVDVFAGVLFNTPAVLSELGTSMAIAAPAASTLGASLEDLAVATGLMADVGIRGSQAGTALRRGMLNLAAPAKGAQEAIAGLGLSAEDAAMAMGEMDINFEDAQAAAQRLGIEVFDAEGNFNGLLNVVKQLRGATKDMTNEQRFGTLQTIFGARAVGAWSVLLDATNDQLANMESAVRKTGVATEIAADRAQSMSGKMKQMEAALNNAKIAFVEANSEGLIKFAETVKKLSDRFSELSPSTQQFIMKFITILVVITPLIFILGQMAIALSALMPLFAGIAAVVSVAAGAIGLASLPLIAIVAIIAAVVIAGILLVKNWEKIKETAMTVWNAIIDTISNFMLRSVEILNGMVTSVIEWGLSIWQAFKDAMNFAVGAVALILDFFLPNWEAKLMALFEAAGKVWGLIKEQFTAAMQFLFDLIAPFAAKISEAWQSFWETVKEIVFGVTDSIKESVGGMFSFISEKVTAALAKVKELANAARSAASGVGSKISGFTSNVIQRGRSITGVNDAVISPNGNVISTNPRDFLIATKNPQGLGGGGAQVIISGNTIVGGDVDGVANAIGDALIRRLNMNMRF